MSATPELLATQLEAVARRLIDRVFEDVYGHGPINAPQLYDLVEQLDQAAWETDRAKALRDAIKKAVRGIPQEPIAKGASLSWRQAALWLFNLEPLDLEHLPGAIYNKICNYIFNSDERLKYISDSAKKEITSKIRWLVAKNLLKLAEPPSPYDKDSQHNDGTFRQYVKRPEYEEWLADRHREGARVFLLHGDAGTGKTTLAKHFGKRGLGANPGNDTPEAAPDSISKGGIPGCVEVDAVTSRSLIDSVVRVLDNHHIEVPTRDVLVKKAFKDLLESSRGPNVLLLENAEEWSEVAELVPSSQQTTIIVTSRYRMAVPPNVTVLHITEMTSCEAISLVQTLAPMSEADAASLAEALGNRPLAISHAAGFIREEDIEVSNFLRLLKQNVAAVLDSIVDDEPTLTAIYQMTIDRLDPDTLHLLDLIATLGHGKISHDVLTRAWANDDLFSFAPREHSIRDLRFRKAFRVLERRDLVRTNEDFSRMIWLHQLTCDIISELRAQSCADIRDSLLRSIEASWALQVWQVGSIPPIMIGLRMPFIRGLLGQFDALMERIDPFSYPRIMKLMALVNYWGQNKNRAMLHYQVLRELISRYAKISEPDASTDARLQALSDLLADLLTWWGIDRVETNTQSSGEIMVTFTIASMRFVFHPTWEQVPLDSASVTGFGTEVVPHSTHTRRVLLSMSGYADDAQSGTWRREQTGTLLLDRSHMEAMLSGLLSPYDLIATLLKRAHPRQAVYATVRDVVGAHNVPAPAPFATGMPVGRTSLIVETAAAIQAEVVLHSSQSTEVLAEGLAVDAEEWLLVTMPDGVARINLDTGAIEWAVPVPFCHGVPRPCADGSLLVVCGEAVLRWDGGNFQIVGSGFTPEASMLPGPVDEAWVTDCERTSNTAQWAVTLTRLGNALGEEKRYTIPLDHNARTATWLSGHRFFLAGDGQFSIVDLDAQTTEPVDAGSIGQFDRLGALARIDHHTVLISSAGGNMYRIDVTTGAKTFVAGFHGLSQLAVGPNGHAYVLAYDRIDRSISLPIIIKLWI